MKIVLALLPFLGSAFSKYATLFLSLALAHVAPLAKSAVGMLSVDEFKRIILKATGYSSFSALAVGVLTFLMVHDGEYIKNATVAYFATMVFGIVIDGLKKANAGEAATSTRKTIAPLEIRAALRLDPLTCTVPGCGFTGKVVDPPSPQ